MALVKNREIWSTLDEEHSSVRSLGDFQVREVIAEKLRLPLEQIRGESLLVEELGADFLGMSDILLALEEMFDIDIDPDDTPSLVRVGDLVAYVRKALLARH